MEPLISVIIPVYNVENFLGQCLDSILCQTYQNLQVILVDDGSTDRSAEICKAYAERDSRIQVIRQENQGAAAARNRGLDHADGEYIAFVDSDDWVHSRMMEKLYAAILTAEAQIAVCDNLDCEGRETVESARENVLPLEVLSNFDVLKKYYYGKADIGMIVVWNKLYQKSLFDHLRFPEGKPVEDVALSYKIIYAASKIVIVHEPLYYYYLTPDSVTRKPFGEEKLVLLLYSREQVAFFSQCNDAELTEKVKIQHIQDLLFTYIRLMDSQIPDKQKICTEIRESFFRTCAEIRKSQYTTQKHKALIRLFKIHPSLLKLAVKTRNVFRKG